MKQAGYFRIFRMNRIAAAGLILTAIAVVSGCSVPERTSVQLEPLHSPEAPVLLDVYSRSVHNEVYSRDGDLLPEPMSTLESDPSLREPAE